MSLRVIRYMNQQSAKCRGQLIAADVPLCTEIRLRQKTNSRCATIQDSVKLIEDLRAACTGGQFRFQERELIRCKYVAFGVREQTIDASGNVAHMERDWCDSKWTLIDFVVGQSSCPTMQIFLSQFQCVKHGTRSCGDFG